MFKFSYRRWHWTFQVQDYLLYKKNEQTMFNENNRHFMILFVTLKETYTFFYEGIFPVSMLDLQ
jgi:hypothetical protein